MPGMRWPKNLLEQLYRKQKGRCALCRLPLRMEKTRIDHDHVTGRVRGILCPYCNSILRYDVRPKQRNSNWLGLNHSLSGTVYAIPLVLVSLSGLQVKLG